MDKPENQSIYKAPSLEICTVVIERGFAESFIPEEGEWD